MAVTGGNPDDFVFDTLTTWAQNVVNEIRNNLTKKDPFLGDSDLAQSITPQVERTDDGYVLTITMNDYWKYVDQGRKPTRSSGNGAVRKNLLLWISKRGIAPQLSQKVYNKKTGKYYNRTFKSSLEWRDSLSYAIASKIHKRGFVSRGKGFFSEVWQEENINELLQTLLTESGEVFVAQILED